MCSKLSGQQVLCVQILRAVSFGEKVHSYSALFLGQLRQACPQDNQHLFQRAVFFFPRLFKAERPLEDSYLN